MAGCGFGFTASFPYSVGIVLVVLVSQVNFLAGTCRGQPFGH